jgi:hypothetical protein
MSEEKEAHGDGRGMKVYTVQWGVGWGVDKKNLGGRRRGEEG